MQINRQAIERLEAAPMKAQSFIDTMSHMVEISAALGCPGDTQMTLDYQGPEVKLEDGDLIPFITIGLRLPTVVEETE